MENLTNTTCSTITNQYKGDFCVIHDFLYGWGYLDNKGRIIWKSELPNHALNDWQIKWRLAWKYYKRWIHGKLPKWVVRKRTPKAFVDCPSLITPRLDAGFPELNSADIVNVQPLANNESTDIQFCLPVVEKTAND